MGWFDEQIKQRKQNDDQLFEEAFVCMADAVLGTKMSSAYQSDELKANGEIGEILKYYKIKPREVPDTVKGLETASSTCCVLMVSCGAMCSWNQAGTRTPWAPCWRRLPLWR